MQENRRCFIRVNSDLVPVSEKVYRAYYQARRHERYLEEKDAAHGLVHYAAFDSHQSTGEEELRDDDAESVEDTTIRHVMAERLRDCLALLPESEQLLIYALFYEGLTERQYAAEAKIPRKTINNRRRVILAKIKRMLETKK